MSVCISERLKGARRRRVGLCSAVRNDFGGSAYCGTSWRVLSSRFMQFGFDFLKNLYTDSVRQCSVGRIVFLPIDGRSRLSSWSALLASWVVCRFGARKQNRVPERKFFFGARLCSGAGILPCIFWDDIACRHRKSEKAIIMIRCWRCREFRRFLLEMGEDDVRMMDEIEKERGTDG